MPFQPVAATALVEIVQELDSQIIENTLYFRRANNYTVSQLEDLCASIEEWWTTLVLPNLAEALTLNRVIATALHASTGPQFVRPASDPFAGGINSDPLPNNNALCVSFRTGLLGRSFRGRNYVAGIAESDTLKSRVNAGRAEAIRAAYADMDSLVPGENVWVVVSRTVDGVVQSPTALTNAVTAVVLVDTVVDSQRRRSPGRGT